MNKRCCGTCRFLDTAGFEPREHRPYSCLFPPPTSFAGLRPYHMLPSDGAECPTFKVREEILRPNPRERVPA